MINNKRVVAFIPVRGGSKGVPRKNEQLLGEHPLMAWSIKQAKSIPNIDRIIVSTDDSRLADIGRQYGAEVFMRPAHLATDTAKVYDVIMDLKDSLLKNNEEYMVLLEATSPFRTKQMIQSALNSLTEYDSVATFIKCRTHPHKVWRLEENKVSTYLPEIDAWGPRQSLPPAYELSGELYGFNLNQLNPKSPSLLVGKSKALVIDSDFAVDINTEDDLALARVLFAKSPLVKEDFL